MRCASLGARPMHTPSSYTWIHMHALCEPRSATSAKPFLLSHERTRDCKAAQKPMTKSEFTNTLQSSRSPAHRRHSQCTP